MRQIPGLLCSMLAVAMLSTPAVARDGGVISSASVSPAGLTVQWFTQVDIAPGGRVVDIDMVVDENNSTTFFAVEYGNSREVISQHDFNAFGRPYGIEGAQQQAELRKEILEKELEALGRDTDIKINKYALPETTLFTLSNTGLVTSIDGDTGKTNWKTKIGSRNRPTVGIGANEDFVAAINGATVYCLEAATGKIVFEQRCSAAVGASPAVTGKLPEPPPADLDGEELEEFKRVNQVTGYVFVPLVNGRLQAFSLAKNGIGSEAYVAVGRSMARPLITEQYVSWPTAMGHYNVAPKDEVRSVAFRVRANDSIVSSGTSQGGLIFFTSLDGYVYAVNQQKGTIVWEFSTGERITQSPIPIGNDLFVISDEHKLFKIDAQSGWSANGWGEPVRGVHDFVGSSKNKLYVTSRTGNLVAIDVNTGQRLGTVNVSGLSLILPNYATDRLYVGRESGLIQCLHEVGSRIPQFKSGEFVEAAKPTEAKPIGSEPIVPTEDDPFKQFDSPDKDEKDSFGAGVKEEDDPFAPKGGGNKSNDEDPFGSGG